MAFSQTGLTQSIISAIGLDASYFTENVIPADTSPHTKDDSGDHTDPLIQDASIMCMILYPSSHTGPDISFVIQQCAPHKLKPTKQHILPS